MVSTTPRSRRKRGLASLLVLGTMFAAFAGIGGPAFAVNSTGAFQLDGDASTATQPFGAPAPDDWDRICRLAAPSACTSPTPTASTTADAASWTNDGALNASIFTGGGSKDPLNIDQWAWKDNTGGLPDKDNLLHGFAARYTKPANSTTCPSPTPTCSLLVFGSDRYDNSGDAQQGFWFFQNKVTADPATGKFVGVHRNGDILVVSHFSNGGAVSTIQVFKWDSSIPGNLTNAKLVSSSPCSATPPQASACGLVNPANGTPSPWAFLDKSGNTSFAQGEFLEAGINLSDPSLGAANTCFSSVLAETRSSDSVSATLKDFVLGQFASCDVTASSAPSVGSGTTITPGTSVTDTLTLTGKGVASPPTPTGSVNFYLCGPLTAPALCNSGGTFVGSGTLSGSGATATATSPAVNTTGFTPGRYCFRTTWAGDSNYQNPVNHTAESECFNVDKNPTVTVTTPVDGSGTPTSTIVLGQSIYDRAVVTGGASGGDPTGSVAFTVCPSSSTPTCSTTATSLGSATLTADSNPATYTASTTSASYTPPSAGSYCFQATYGGNGVYYGSSDSRVNECFNVITLPSSTVTTPTDSSGTPTSVITLGGTIHDVAVVTGESRGGDPSGNVSFSVCGPAETGLCTTGGTSLGTKALVSDGAPATFTSSASSDDFTPTLPGRYCFRADYAGSAPYLGSSDSSSTECFIVKDTTTTSSAQTWVPNDTSHVVLSGGSPAAGSVLFELKTGTCAAPGSTLYSETVALDGSGYASTANSSVSVSTTSDVVWINTYTPSDTSRVTGSTHCESTGLTIVN